MKKMGTQFNFSHVTMMHENMCIINVFVYMYVQNKTSEDFVLRG